MSLKAEIEIILNLHEFKNIALPHRAKYLLTAEIYQGKIKKNYALPYNIIETSTKSQKHVVSSSSMDDMQFKSKIFKIAYHEEVIQLNDLCQFKMTVDAFPTLDEDNFYLQFTLYENGDNFFQDEIEEHLQFKEAQKYRFQLASIPSGILNYCEGQFPKSYISSFNFTLFLHISYYKFTSYTSNKSQSIKENARQKINDLDELMAWSQKYYPKICSDPDQYFYQNYVKNSRYNLFLMKSSINSILKKPKQEVELFAPLSENDQLMKVNEKQFFEYITNFRPKHLDGDQIIKQLYKIHEESFYLVQQVIDFFQKADFNLNKLRNNFNLYQKERYQERIFQTIQFGHAVNEGEENIKIAKKMRKKKSHTFESRIIDEYLHVEKIHHHYAFFQINLPDKLKTKNFQESPSDQVLKELNQMRKSQQSKHSYDERNMLIIFVHGFQASSYDMEILKREIHKIMPIAYFHCSTSNESDTEMDIGHMGLKLATEIKTYIEKNMEEKQVMINFVCHSMGGLIARSSLQYLTQFQNHQFGFYFSLSSPHLGYLNGVDGMIKTGLWFMRKTKDILSLDQLAMEDAEQLKDTFLFQLSHKGHLQNFQKIILASSTQDNYVPWHSARISPYSSKNSKAKIQNQMIDKILGEKIVHRVDIHFDIETKDLDSFIGRTAHINLIVQECIMKLLNYGIPNLFDITQI